MILNNAIHITPFELHAKFLEIIENSSDFDSTPHCDKASCLQFKHSDTELAFAIFCKGAESFALLFTEQMQEVKAAQEAEQEAVHHVASGNRLN